jgi:multimeric flavodoxin WrbA
LNFIVLNGSPKGDISVTMQYIKYIQNNFKEHQFKIFNITHEINKIENDMATFDDIVRQISLSDGVIWAFPVYYYVVPSNYMRFIELIFERNAAPAFKDKYTAVLTTSLNYMDHTAHNYINSICDDLNMHYADYYSANMYDLQKEDKRNDLLLFIRNLCDAIRKHSLTLKNFDQVCFSPIEYHPGLSHDKIDLSGKKLVIVADSLENSNLKNMIEKFRNSFTGNVDLVVLRDIKIVGSCLGCIKCAYDFNCIYNGKDDFINMYNEKLKTADIIIFAGAIKYRYLSSEWKRFFDRSFFNNHTPSLIGKQIGIIISGPLRQIPNLRQIIEVFVLKQRSNLVGFITDEYQSSKEIDQQLNAFTSNLARLSAENYIKPETFMGVAGKRMIRDEIWGWMRFPFYADHKAFKALKMYNFPQYNLSPRIKNAFLLLICKIPFIRRKIYNNMMIDAIVSPVKKYAGTPN